MKTLIPIIAVIASMTSAGLWFWSASLKPVYPAAYLSGPPKEIVDRIHLQTRLNAWAAFATGISAALQGITLILN